MSDAIITAEKLVKRYSSPDGTAITVLNEVSLSVDNSGSLAIVGPSGSGKSTLLNLLGALDMPDAGDVVINGRSIAALDEKERARIRNAEIGFVFQQHHLLPQLTVLENAVLPALAFASRIPDEIFARARALCERVGIASRIDHLPGTISGGERQRAAIVRALIMQPKLLLADEPTGSLDRAAATDIADLLVELNREEGLALITVTHAEDVAARMDKAVHLSGGTVVTIR